MTLGQNIQTARRAKGLSQEALAERIGVSRQALGKWEKDTALPGLDNLQVLAAELGTGVDALLGAEQADPAAPAVTLDALRDLLAANRDIHPARLMVGDVLCIPREEDDTPSAGTGTGNAGSSGSSTRKHRMSVG